MKVLIAALGLAVLLFLGGCAERTDSYDTLDEAREANLFAKGWLPEHILPASTERIRVSTIVDVAAGSGNFFFACPDYTTIGSKLRPFGSEHSSIAEQNALISNRIAQGYEALVYSEAPATWVFLCTRQTSACGCDFVVWHRE